jgi:hypothetical protein
VDVVVPPGRYKTPPGFEMPFEFETVDRFIWYSEYLELDRLPVLVRGANLSGKPTRWLAFIPLSPGETVDSAPEALRSTPQIDLLDETEISLAEWPAGSSTRPLS